MKTVIYAFILGVYERARYGDGFGMTWDDNQDANEAYDSGANVVDNVRALFDKEYREWRRTYG